MSFSVQQAKVNYTLPDSLFTLPPELVESLGNQRSEARESSPPVDPTILEDEVPS